MNDKFTFRDFIDRSVFALSFALLWISGLAVGLLVGYAFFQIMLAIYPEASLSLQIFNAGIQATVGIIFLIPIKRRLFLNGFWAGSKEIAWGKLSLAEKGHLLPRYFAFGIPSGLAINGLAILGSLIIVTNL